MACAVFIIQLDGEALIVQNTFECPTRRAVAVMQRFVERTEKQRVEEYVSKNMGKVDFLTVDGYVVFFVPYPSIIIATLIPPDESPFHARYVLKTLETLLWKQCKGLHFSSTTIAKKAPLLSMAIVSLLEDGEISSDIADLGDNVGKRLLPDQIFALEFGIDHPVSFVHSSFDPSNIDELVPCPFPSELLSADFPSSSVPQPTSSSYLKPATKEMRRPISDWFNVENGAIQVGERGIDSNIHDNQNAQDSTVVFLDDSVDESSRENRLDFGNQLSESTSGAIGAASSSKGSRSVRSFAEDESAPSIFSGSTSVDDEVKSDADQFELKSMEEGESLDEYVDVGRETYSEATATTNDARRTSISGVEDLRQTKADEEDDMSSNASLYSVSSSDYSDGSVGESDDDDDEGRGRGRKEAKEPERIIESSLSSKLSTSTLERSFVIPISFSVRENVDLMYEGSELRYIRIYGGVYLKVEISGVIKEIETFLTQFQFPDIHFMLNNTHSLKYQRCNPRFLKQVQSHISGGVDESGMQKSSTEYCFSFPIGSLSPIVSPAAYDAPMEILKYEVVLEQSVELLRGMVMWKVEPSRSIVHFHYALNERLGIELNDVAVLVSLRKKDASSSSSSSSSSAPLVTKVQSKPIGLWNGDQHKLLWNVPSPLSPDSHLSPGKLMALFETSEACDETVPVLMKFQSNSEDSTRTRSLLSPISIELLNSNFGGNVSYKLNSMSAHLRSGRCEVRP